MPNRRFKRFEFPKREPVLSPRALAYARKITRNRKLAIDFLKRHGFIERPGRLARPYRSD